MWCARRRRSRLDARGRRPIFSWAHFGTVRSSTIYSTKIRLCGGCIGAKLNVEIGNRHLAYTRLVTEVLREDRYVTSDLALCCQLLEEFRMWGPAYYAKVFDTSEETARAVLAGRESPNMDRVAYNYGFMPEDRPEGWRALPMHEPPFDAGPHRRWGTRIVRYVENVLTSSHRPDVSELAWRMDTTEARLRYAIKKHGIVPAHRSSRSSG